MNIINFDNYQISDKNGSYTGVDGSKEGIIYNDENWLIKYPKSIKGINRIDTSYTTSPLSEFIGSHIYEILGNDVHKTLLGIRNNKLVVACKDFCINGKELREIRAIKNIYNEELSRKLEEQLHSTSLNHYVDLQEILIHLENNPILSKIPNIKARFWDCVVIDGLINNNVRNNGNWGLLYQNGNYELAPIYDNGASFSNKLSDNQIESIILSKEKLEQSALNTTTGYSLNDHVLLYKEILNLENAELKQSILKLTPIIEQKMPEIKNFMDGIPEEENNLPVLSKERKAFYWQSLELRFKEILLKRYIEIKK